MESNKWYIKKGIVLVIISCIVAVSSALKEIVFAGAFGVSYMADAYTISITIPEILFSVIWNALNAVFIPQYTKKLITDDRNASSQFVSVILSLICALTVSFVLISELVAPVWVYLFAPGFSKEAHDLSVELTRIVFPILFFEGIIRVFSGLLQAHKSFFVPKALVIIRNINVVVMIGLLSSKIGIYVAAYALLTGAIVESVIAYLFSRKYDRLKLQAFWKDDDIKEIGKISTPIIVGSGVGEINILVDRVIASYLNTGSMSAMHYSSKLETIITTVILFNIVSIVFPSISEFIAKKEYVQVKTMYEKAIKVVLLIGIPIIFGGAVVGEDIIELVFMRGQFSASDVKLVSPIFSVYLISSVFITIRTITSNIFVAYGETKTIMFNTVIGVIINIVLNIVLSSCFGLIGIALATSISAIVTCGILFYKLNKEYLKIDKKTIAILFIKTIIASIAMMISIFIVRNTFLNSINASTLIHIILTIAIVLMGIVVYLIMLTVFKTKELNSMFKLILRK